MQTRPQRLRFYGGMFVLALGAFVIFIVSLAQGPDYSIHFERTILSKDPPAEIGKAISSLAQWPRWFYSTVDAKAIDLTGTPYSLKDQVLQKGSIVRLYVDPHKGRWKKFEVTVAVTDYVPEKMIKLHFLQDSKGKILRLFDQLDWTVEISPNPGGGTIIHGTEDAHTCHWRSRVIGKLAQKILMNNVFYPDLFKLSELKRQPQESPFFPPSSQ